MQFLSCQGFGLCIHTGGPGSCGVRGLKLAAAPEGEKLCRILTSALDFMSGFTGAPVRAQGILPKSTQTAVSWIRCAVAERLR